MIPPLPRGCLLLAALALLAAGAAAGQPAPGQAPKQPTAGEKDGKGGKPDPGGKKPPPDKLKSPAPAVLVTVDEQKDPLRPSPTIFVLTPEQWKEVREKLLQLDKQQKPERVVPYACKLSGRVEGGFAYLQASFEMTTEHPRTVVFLGCLGAVVTELEQNSDVIPLPPGDDGYAVQVLKPGKHAVTMHLKLPVIVQHAVTLAGGPEHSLELGLPGAALNKVSLELPPPVKEVRWNSATDKHAGPGPKEGPWVTYVSGAKSLKVSWREPAAVPEVQALPSAKWLTTFQVQESQVLVTAKLTLTDPRARTKERRLLTPPEAEVRVLGPDATAYSLTAADNNSTFTIAGPPAESLEAVVTVRYPRPFTKLPVGPFLALGAERQEGTIEVRAADDVLRGFRLDYVRRGEARQQDPTREQAGNDLRACFQYWQTAEAGKGLKPNKAAKQPPVEVELKQVVALVETYVEHVLQLRAGEPGWHVQAQTRIQATPRHAGTDYLDVQLPRPQPPALPVLAVLAGASQAGFPHGLLDLVAAAEAEGLWPVQPPAQFDFTDPAGGPLKAEPIPGQRRVRVHLGAAQAQKFTAVVTGRYAVLAGADTARLELPRPVTLLDRGGMITAEADDQTELLPPEAAGEPAAGRQRYTLAFERAPAFAELAWRAYRPEVPAAVLADVELGPRQARVRQEVRLRFPARAGGAARPEPGSRTLHMELTPRARVSSLSARGGKLLDYNAASGVARVEASGAEPVVLEYEFAPATPADRRGPPADPGQRFFPVPLFRPREATQVEAKVRVWTEPGTLPALPEADLAGERWRDVRAEVVPGRDSLPALVARGEGLDTPLLVRLLDSTLPPLAGVQIDRALVQVLVDDEGGRHYRARFLLTKVHADHLRVEFPAAVARLVKPQFLLDGKHAPWAELTAGGRVARVEVNPALYQQRPALLDISYQLLPDVPEPDGIWQAWLAPPRLQGDVFVGRVRWAVTLPAGRQALPPGGHAAAESQWARRGWLLAPEPAVTGRDLEAWLSGKATDDAFPAPGLVFWADSLAPVTVVHMPQQFWLLGCSGALLAVGLVLLTAPVSRLVFWCLALMLVLGTVAAGAAWPSLLPALLYGFEPGAAVLLLLVVVQWLLHQRYRRQVVFMPGFSRARPGSTHPRGSSVNRRPAGRETSTVDAPPSVPGNQSSAKGAAS